MQTFLRSGDEKKAASEPMAAQSATRIKRGKKMRKEVSGWSRRSFLSKAAAAAAGTSAAPSLCRAAQAAERIRTTIKDVQTMTIGGPSRTYVYIRITTADGHAGVGEGYGTPGMGTAENVQALKPTLVGKDPLEIDKLYTYLGGGARSLEGSRTDGSAHNLMRAASAVEMALWDLAGNLLREPVSILMGGKFRNRVRVYDHSRPKDMFDKASCREWADKVRADPSGFTAHKVELPRTDTIWEEGRNVPDNGHDMANRELTTKELMRIAQAFENMREAIGWEHDLMVHCHWQFDLPSSLRLAEAVAPIKPLWLEDPLGVDYSPSWKLLTERSPVAILTGENLARVEGFVPFITNLGCNIVNPDLRNSGGFLEAKKIADLAALYGLPMTTHGTGSQLYTYQVCQWAASIRDYLVCETVTGQGGWMDDILVLDGPYIQKGYVAVADKPGTGAVLNRKVVEAHLLPGEKWWGEP
jgi:L-alanine-DL-glutamate epimerase-like enolase superfamily enzyme